MRDAQASKIKTGVLVAALGALLAGGCSDDAPDGSPPERRVLEAAIRAQWGECDPTNVTNRKTRSVVHLTRTENGPGYVQETWVSADRYRERRVWKDFGFSESFVQLGDECWATVDGTVVPLDEEREAIRKLQPRLFEIGKLAPLLDETRFDVAYLGRGHGAATGEVERVAVTARGTVRLGLTLEFATATHLLARVTMEGEPRLVVELDDYRPIDGVMLAHRIVSLRGEDAVAWQTVQSVAFNVPLDEAAFKRPVDLNRDAVLEKDSVAGLMARALHEDHPDDVDDTIAELKAWVEAEELRVVGPLVVARPLPRGGEATNGRPAPVEVWIAVARATPASETKATAANDARFTLVRLEARRALCLTHVGERPYQELTSRLAAAAKERGLKPTGRAYEVFISPDRIVRQVQVPVE